MNFYHPFSKKKESSPKHFKTRKMIIAWLAFLVDVYQHSDTLLKMFKMKSTFTCKNFQKSLFRHPFPLLLLFCCCLAPTKLQAQCVTAKKISDTQGGLSTALDDNDRFGYSVSNIGDLDGDGILDIALGAYQYDDGGGDKGAVYILFLNTDGTVKAEQKISDTQGGLSAALDNSDNFGLSVSNIGDLDGDGIPDIGVGAYRDDDGGGDRGAVYILFLNTDGTVKAEQKISDTQGVGISKENKTVPHFLIKVSIKKEAFTLSAITKIQ